MIKLTFDKNNKNKNECHLGRYKLHMGYKKCVPILWIYNNGSPIGRSKEVSYKPLIKMEQLKKRLHD